MLIKKLQMMPWSFKVETKVQSSRLQLKFQGLNALKKTRLAKKTNKKIRPTLATKIIKSPIEQTTYQINELSNERS
jgi:hypothetical protein